MTISEYEYSMECVYSETPLDLGVQALQTHRGGRTHQQTQVGGPGVKRPVSSSKEPKPQKDEPCWVPMICAQASITCVT